MHSITDKDAIRKKILSERKSLEGGFVAAASEAILDRLFALKEYRDAKLISTYVGFRGEVMTYPMIKIALMEGKRVACPKVEDGDMSFYLIESSGELEAGFMGIPEPRPVKIAPSEDMLMIMPGVVFDEKCHRIGYGGGYYDRFLSKYPKHCDKIALAYEFQVLDEIPSEPHDVCPDIIITEKRIIKRK